MPLPPLIPRYVLPILLALAAVLMALWLNVKNGWLIAFLAALALVFGVGYVGVCKLARLEKSKAAARWWRFCAFAVVGAYITGDRELEKRALAAPLDMEPKLEAYHKAHGHYPESLAQVAPLDLRRLYLGYRTNGRLYEFTILKHNPEPQLWIFDGTTKVWSRE